MLTGLCEPCPRPPAQIHARHQSSRAGLQTSCWASSPCMSPSRPGGGCCRRGRQPGKLDETREPETTVRNNTGVYGGRRSLAPSFRAIVLAAMWRRKFLSRLLRVPFTRRLVPRCRVKILDARFAYILGPPWDWATCSLPKGHKGPHVWLNQEPLPWNVPVRKMPKPRPRFQVTKVASPPDKS